MFCFLWHLEKRFLLSSTSTGLQDTCYIVKTCQLVQLLCSDVLTLSLCKTDSEEISVMLPYRSRIYDIFGMIWYILISIYYVNWHFLFVLEIGMFEFVSLDAKYLRSIALVSWLPISNNSLQSILFGPADTDIWKWLVHIIS